MKDGMALRLLLVLALFPVWAGEDVLKAFHERFDKENSALKRREAVLSLKGSTDERVVAELAALLPKRRQAEDDPVVQAICEVLASFDKPAAATPLLALALKSRVQAKDVLFVREALKTCRSPGVMKAVCETGLASPDPMMLEAMADVLAASGHPPAAARLKALMSHAEPRVRAAAAEAYGRCAGPAGAEALRPLLSCGEPIVADAALAGLAWLKDAGSWKEIERGLTKGALPLRCRLIRALGSWKGDETALKALVDALAREHGRALPLLASSLEQATGQRFGTDAEAWRSWWAARGGTPPSEGVDTAHAKPLEYFEVRFFCDRVVFVEDISGSMNVGLAGAKATGALKIDRSKEALSKALSGLDPRIHFNLITFSTTPESWKPALVPATPENVAKAREYIAGLKAFGFTNIRDALTLATGALMKRRDRGGLSTGYELQGADTVFLFTDGRPTLKTGARSRSVTWDDAYGILAEFTFANRFQDLQLFTLGMTGDEKNQDDIDPVFLDLLARWNGGTYTFLK